VNKAVQTMSKWGVPTVTFDNKSEHHKQQLIEGAAELCAIFRDRFGLDLFVAYGVLLGFTRAGDFIGHDDDFDLAYISPLKTKAEIYRQSVEIVEALIGLGYQVRLTSYGQYKLIKRAKRERLKFEIFVGWTEEDRTYLYFGIDKGVDPSAFLPIGQRDFHGVSLPIPNDPARVNAAIYGPGWREPDPDFRYELDKEKWRPFLFLRSAPNLGYWNDYYAGKRPDEPWSLSPSPFAAFTAEHRERGRLLEIGCGNGRDSLFFASQGFDVHGVDYCETAVALCAERARQAAAPAQFEPLNLYDVAQVAAFINANADAFDTLYARFFVHAVTETGEAELLKLAARVLKPGGRVYLEFRTREDGRAAVGRPISDSEREDGHYRRFIDVDALIEHAGRHGFSVAYRVAGHGMAAFGGEDPHVARLVLEKPRDGAGAD
jgi:SAM-dependent methyltransferase